MISENTPERIASLCATIADSSVELELLIKSLSREADACMASACEEFLAVYADRNKGPIFSDYDNAHEALLKATGCAANLRELTTRAATLHSKVDWWKQAFSGARQPSDIARVMELLLKPKTAAAVRNQVARMVKDGMPGAYFIEQNWDTLPDNQWILAGPNGLVRRDPSLETILKVIKDCRIPVDELTLVFKTGASPQAEETGSD